MDRTLHIDKLRDRIALFDSRDEALEWIFSRNTTDLTASETLTFDIAAVGLLNERFGWPERVKDKT